MPFVVSKLLLQLAFLVMHSHQLRGGGLEIGVCLGKLQNDRVVRK